MTRPRSAWAASLCIAAALLCSASSAAQREREVARRGVRSVTWSPHAVYKGRQVTLGPTGARGWIEGHRIHVVDVAKGSPADGLLSRGDVLLGANGATFEEGQDPRVALGNAITASETAQKGGTLALLVERDGQPTTVQVPLRVMGSYSPTWPYQCAKSARILAEATARLASVQYPDGHIQGELGMPTTFAGLLFLASGQAQHLDNARRAAYWLAAQSYEGVGLNNWPVGYSNLFLAEYYLATGDRAVLPRLESQARLLVKGMMRCGSWGHTSRWDGYGAVNQVGLVCFMALVLTRECGIAVDEAALRRSAEFFGKYAGKGRIPYGDHAPWRGKSGNGKDALAAVAFQLLGSRPDAVRDYSRSVAASYAYREQGHTGCYFALFWGPLAAVHAGTDRFRTFLDHQRWYYDLARTHDGGLVCQPNDENLGGRTPGHYTWCGPEFTTAGMALVYALPLRTLRILGAGRSVFTGTLPAPLAKARALFQQRKDAELRAALARLTNGATLSREHKRLAGQLAAAAEAQRQSVGLTLVAVEDSVREGDAYRASELLKSLECLLGKDCPTLAPMQKLLADNSRWVDEGRKYYAAWSTLKDYTWQYWHFYGHQGMDLLERVGPPPIPRHWHPLVETSEKTPQTWRAFPWGATDAEADPTRARLKGWHEPGFDDSAWQATPGPMQARRGKATAWNTRHILLRRTFVLPDPHYSHLRLTLKSVKGQTAEVYLNGVLVARAVDAQRRRYAPIPLDAKAPSLLRKGKNCLAVHATNAGGKGQSLDLGLQGARR